VVGTRHLRIEREVKHRSVGGGLARSDQRKIHRGDEIGAAQHDQPRAVLGAIAREQPAAEEGILVGYALGIAVASVPCYNRGILLSQVVAGRSWQAGRGSYRDSLEWTSGSAQRTRSDPRTP
jgi:hypothetical protein